MSTEYFHHIHLPILIPFVLLTPTATHPPDKTSFVFLFSVFVKNKMALCLFKIATQEVSLWYSHVCMYYNPKWFIPSIFLLSTLVPVLRALCMKTWQ
jgi:hypothetical protein